MSWLRSALAAACLFAPAAAFAAACDSPRQMDGFKTCADVAKAEQEGSFVLYSPDPEANQAALLKAFHEAFPKINATYLRLQTGALYAKLMAERQARTYMPDALTLTDMTFVIDFKKRGG